VTERSRHEEGTLLSPESDDQVVLEDDGDLR
jgi:hypothetical protein